MEFHLLITSEEREVQIYYYDGWKFHESTLDFTGNVFSSGVVSMRYYDDIIDNTTTIGELRKISKPHIHYQNYYFIP